MNLEKIEKIIIFGSSVTALALARNAYFNNIKPIIIDDEIGLAFGSNLSSNYLLRHKSKSKLCQLICELGESQKNIFVAASDYWLKYLFEFRTQIDKNYKIVLHPSNDILFKCLNKREFAFLCRSNGFLTPEIFTDKEAEQLLTKKDKKNRIILRPENPYFEKKRPPIKAVELNTIDVFEYWKHLFIKGDMKYILSESVLNNKIIQYSVGLVKSGDNIKLIKAVKKRPLPNQLSVGCYVELEPHNDQLTEIVKKFCEKIDYFGIGEMELFYIPQKNVYYLIEFNARPWTQYALTYSSGNDFFKFLFDTKPRMEFSKKKKAAWISFGDDFYFCFSQKRGLIPSSQLKLKEYIKSLFKIRACSIFSIKDIRPYFFNKKLIKPNFEILQ